MPCQERSIMKKPAIGSALLAGISSFAFGSPDLVCSEINGANSFGSDGMGMVAYSFGTTICNIGDAPAPWDANSNSHPLISQSIYKLKDHQITQIGIGFVRHTTIPLSGNACGLGCDPAGSGALGVGCSDTSSSSVNGAQGLMGPRREVNALSGEYPYPFTSINLTGDAVYKRTQVLSSDISDPDALYFVETQVISPAESTAQSRNNNVSYRQVTFQPGTLNATLVGPTYDQQPAINAWRDHGNGIGIPDEDVIIRWRVLTEGDGLVGVGSRPTELGADQWRLDYSVYNMNRDLGVQGLVVSNTSLSDVLSGSSFHAPLYHDDLDEQTSNAPWDAGEFGWNGWYTDRFVDDPDANAIRWGTTYSFSMELEDIGPEIGTVSVTPFESYNYSFRVQAWKPGQVCSADLAGNPDGSPDGYLNFLEISAYLLHFGAESPLADFAGNPDGSPDGRFNFADVAEYLRLFQAGCP